MIKVTLYHLLLLFSHTLFYKTIMLAFIDNSPKPVNIECTIKMELLFHSYWVIEPFCEV